MRNIFNIVYILSFLFLSSCIFDKGTTKIDFGKNPDPYLVRKAGGSVGSVDSAVSNISIVNDQLIINGSDL